VAGEGGGEHAGDAVPRHEAGHAGLHGGASRRVCADASLMVVLTVMQIIWSQQIEECLEHDKRIKQLRAFYETKLTELETMADATWGDLKKFAYHPGRCHHHRASDRYIHIMHTYIHTYTSYIHTYIHTYINPH